MLLRWLRRLLVSVIILASLFAIAIIMVFFLAIEQQPLHSDEIVVDAVTAKRAQQLAKRVLGQLNTQQQTFSFTATEPELNGLIAIAKHANNNFNGRIDITSVGLYCVLSQQITSKHIAQYLNISLLIGPSTQGLNLTQVNIGKLTLSGPTTLTVGKFLLNQLLGDNTGDVLIQSIRTVALHEQSIRVDYQLPKKFAEHKGLLFEKLARASAPFTPEIDPLLIRQYYQTLINYSETQTTVTVPLNNMITALFQSAQQQTEKEKQNDAVEQNRAALLALALYLGPSKLEYLLGNIRTNAMKKHKIKQNVTLANRVDLQQHFVYSAAIEIFSTLGVSNAIGELKELLDSNNDGSGFSFVDLMADRAGVRFTQLATANQTSALRLQQLLSSNVDENQLLPLIAGLPEGLRKMQFERDYKNINARQYKNQLAEIEQRLAALPLYQIKVN